MIYGQILTQGWQKKFMTIPEKGFTGLSVMTVADLFRLAPVRGKLIFFQFFCKDTMKHLLGIYDSYDIYLFIQKMPC